MPTHRAVVPCRLLRAAYQMKMRTAQEPFSFPGQVKAHCSASCPLPEALDGHSRPSVRPTSAQHDAQPDCCLLRAWHCPTAQVKPLGMQARLWGPRSAYPSRAALLAGQATILLLGPWSGLILLKCLAGF